MEWDYLHTRYLNWWSTASSIFNYLRTCSEKRSHRLQMGWKKHILRAKPNLSVFFFTHRIALTIFHSMGEIFDQIPYYLHMTTWCNYHIIKVRVLSSIAKHKNTAAEAFETLMLNLCIAPDGLRAALIWPLIALLNLWEPGFQKGSTAYHCMMY